MVVKIKIHSSCSLYRLCGGSLILKLLSGGRGECSCLMGMGGNENSTLSHFPTAGSWSSDTIMDSCFAVVCHKLLGLVSILDVHETLLVWTLHVYFLKIWLTFLFL